MKKIFTLLLIIAASFLFNSASANTVYVSGYVKNNGVAVANKAVKIWVDSANAGPSCYQLHTKYTNANGFYSDTLNCGSNITIVKTSIEGCNGALVTNTTQVNANNGAESNFNLTCAPPTPTCNANYTFNISKDTVRFYNTSTANSTITSFFWSFGDGSQSTTQNPTHIYAANGTYNVCLSIASSTGCQDTVCKTVTIAVTNPTPTCSAGFQFVKDSTNYKSVTFFTGNATQVVTGETAVQRVWIWGDSDSSVSNVTSNGQTINHVYANAGSYTVCLKVKTVSGCMAQSCQVVTVSAPPPFVCTAVAGFTYIPVSSLVKFNSNISTPGINDTIISRKWVFGDSTAPLTGNAVDPQHQYAQPGVYNVCLTIKTSKGCERTYCAIVTATNVNSNCVPQFTFQKIAPKNVAFNSTMSWVPQNDSIVERKWTFGDGTSLVGAFGSAASPTHQYNNNGIYTVCLKIKTGKGCINEICKPVVIFDSTTVQPPINEPIKIISIYPNPVTVQMATVVWSANNNVTAELAIYDIYGMKKWSTNKTLSQGNNFTIVPTGFLPGGPYFFRVTTSYGVKSRAFYKL